MLGDSDQQTWTCLASDRGLCIFEANGGYGDRQNIGLPGLVCEIVKTSLHKEDISRGGRSSPG